MVLSHWKGGLNLRLGFRVLHVGCDNTNQKLKDNLTFSQFHMIIPPGSCLYLSVMILASGLTFTVLVPVNCP